jgi:hypothetical protein
MHSNFKKAIILKKPPSLRAKGGFYFFYFKLSYCTPEHPRRIIMTTRFAGMLFIINCPSLQIVRNYKINILKQQAFLEKILQK